MWDDARPCKSGFEYQGKPSPTSEGLTLPRVPLLAQRALQFLPLSGRLRRRTPDQVEHRAPPVLRGLLPHEHIDGVPLGEPGRNDLNAAPWEYLRSNAHHLCHKNLELAILPPAQPIAGLEHYAGP